MRDNSSSSSTQLRFGSEELCSLRDEICRPFTEMTITLDRVRTPTQLVLWRKDNTGLAIWSEMHGLAERIEVGVLSFSKTTRTSERIPDGYWETVENFSTTAFGGQNLVIKLVIDESGYSCESGFIIKSTFGDELLVVADAFPCHIAVFGIDGLQSASRSEYDLSRYTQSNW